MTASKSTHGASPTLPAGRTRGKGRERSERVEGRWSYDDGMSYTDLREAELKNGGSYRAKNPWEMPNLAKQLQGWRNGTEVPVSKDLDDLTYFGKEIWYDTP